MRVFLTGASGCVGHYISENLIQNTDWELFLMVRNPQKLKVDVAARSGVNVVCGDMLTIETQADLLKTMDAAILTAAGWGGQEAYDINYQKTHELLELLDADRCQQVIYFATESILNRQNNLLPEAGSIGTDYVRTKYQGYAGIADLKISPKVTAVFPSLVFGGDDRKPLSHIVSGWKDIVKWLWLVRWVTADGSFHFIHGKDIAEVVRHLLANPQAADEYDRKLVLGNEPITVDRAIEEICQYYGKPSYARLPLSISLTEVVIKVFKIQVAEWDRFCMKNRHFTHEKYVNPRSFNLSSYAATIPDLMQAIDN